MISDRLAKLLPRLESLAEIEDKKHRQAAEKRRPALAAALEELERQNAVRGPALAGALEAGDAKVARARIELDAAEADRDAAFYALAGHSTEYQLRKSKLEAELRETADPAIAAAREELEAELDRTRRRSTETSEVVDVDRVFGKKTTTVYSALPSIRRRLEALRAMRTALDQLEPAVNVDVPARIAQLWSSIPEIGPAEPFVRRRPGVVE